MLAHCWIMWVDCGQVWAGASLRHVGPLWYGPFGAHSSFALCSRRDGFLWATDCGLTLRKPTIPTMPAIGRPIASNVHTVDVHRDVTIKTVNAKNTYVKLILK